jgi:hypothetical protein
MIGRKKNLKFLGIMLLIFTFLSGTIAGGTISEMIKVYRNTAQIQVNHTLVTKDNFLYEGTTYIPLRAVSELLGKDVSWDPITKMASINDPTIILEKYLYFPDKDAMDVWPELRLVTVIDGRADLALMQGLIAGPTSLTLTKSIPDGTRLLSVRTSGGICTVDFSKEFIDNHWGGSAGEMMTLGSIVRTLTQLPSVDKVMILVEGKSGETLGNILLDHPLEP